MLAVCGALCVACYLVTVFSPWPIFSLLGCALTGLSVSLMWPGVFSLSSRTFPRGGTAMFGMLAIFGDLGGSLGAVAVRRGVRCFPKAAGCLTVGGFHRGGAFPSGVEKRYFSGYAVPAVAAGRFGHVPRAQEKQSL